MTRDDIKNLMKQACDPDKKPAWHNDFWTVTQEELERFAALVAAKPKPLSDGKIGRLCGRFDASHSVAIGIARAIEKAHGIGEKE
jgi:hypothetical protein